MFDTWQLRPSLPSASTPLPPAVATVALCVVGVASLAMRPKTEKPAVAAHPITDSRTYAPMARWRRELREMGEASDVFLVLDLADGWLPRGPAAANQQMAMHAAGSAEWRRRHSNTSRAALQPMLDALSAAAVVEYAVPPYCAARRDCACGANVGAVRAALTQASDPKGGSMALWWEQQAKLPICLAQIERAEGRRGARYDYVAKLRSDAPLMAAGPTPAAIADAVRGPAHGAWVAPWTHGMGREGCYRESDWAALVSRSLAHVYFNLSADAWCAWATCFVERHLSAPHRLPSLHCLNAEHLLIEWLVWHRVPVRPLASEWVASERWQRAQPRAVLVRTAWEPWLTAPSELTKAQHALSSQRGLTDRHPWHAAAYAYDVAWLLRADSNASTRHGASVRLSAGCQQQLSARAGSAPARSSTVAIRDLTGR
jgi:hypothetical protein